ncbi:hypothetical protein ACHAWF_010384 [Thalassiosira exigua]
MAFTQYYASTYLSAAKIFFRERPRKPPNSPISGFLVLLMCMGIYSLLTLILLNNLRRQRNARPRKRRRKRSPEAITRKKLKRSMCRKSGPAGNGIASARACEGGTKDSYKSATTCACEGDSIHRSIRGFTTSLADADIETLNSQTEFDTDSIFFVCDNSTTGHICNDISKFVDGSLHQTNRQLTTANGSGPCLQEGTVRIHLTDDDGKRHLFTLDNCIYMPDSPVNLLSTRRLAEKFLDAKGQPDEETRIESRYSTHVLHWCQGHFKKTFPTPISGLPELLFDEGYTAFHSFASKVNAPSPHLIPFEEDEIVPDQSLFMQNESVIFNNGQGTVENAIYVGPEDYNGVLKHKVKRSTGEAFLVDRENLSPADGSDWLDLSLSDAQKELLELHYRLNHVSFPTLIDMAEKGEIPKRLAKLKGNTPVCMSCIFGTALHRRPWRTKGKPGKIRKAEENAPGKCTSVDQLVSAQPGLIPQMSGFLTNKRIWGATVFVDHFSDYVYVALMRDLSLDETLQAKSAFERLANDGGVKIEAYRADNGRFADQGFRDAIHHCNQKITFCAVGSHHQNGIAERKIKELTLIARTLLLHATRQPRGEVHAEALFFGATDRPRDPSLFHTFGSPCFVLDSCLQSSVGGVPKWEPRSRLGIYVGHSPAHAGSVALVLNPATGHVSPQFHVVFDDNFTTVPYMKNDSVPPNWAELVDTSCDDISDEQFQLQYELASTWLSNDVASSSDPSASAREGVLGAPTCPDSSQGPRPDSSQEPRPDSSQGPRPDSSQGTNDLNPFGVIG